MTALRFRDLPVHVERWGSGPILVLLHAGGSLGAQWKAVAELLLAERLVLAPDLIGAGRTPTWPGPGALTHDLQAACVVTLIEAEAVGGIDLVGHSYGGATALRLALLRPDLVRRLVLIEPIVPGLLREAGDPLFEEYQNVAEAFIARVEAGKAAEAWSHFLDYRNGPGAWHAVRDGARARLLAQSAESVASLRANLGNPTSLADLRTLTMPTAILHGEASTAPDLRMTELVRQAVPGCLGAEIPGAGHMAPITHPQQVARLVAALLPPGKAGLGIPRR